MQTTLAWSNLKHKLGRTVVAVAGIAFAIILIFMQFGFWGAAVVTATSIYDELRFDLLVVSPEYGEFNNPGSFPRGRLSQVHAHPAVDEAVPLYVGFNMWKIPNGAAGPAAPPADDAEQQRLRRIIMVLGVRPSDPVFKLDEVQRQQENLKEPNTALFDLLSHPDFRYDELMRQPERPGATELGTTQIQIIGTFELRTGFAADGLLVMSDQTFSRIYGGKPLDDVSLGLVQLKPGADAAVVAQELNQRLPPDVCVLTRAEIEARERHHWEWDTNIGLIFVFGTVVALVVGVVFVYQVISSDIANRLGEFATLKALGYPDWSLFVTVLYQAMILAWFGYLAGLAVSMALYVVTYVQTRMPIFMSWQRLVLVLGLAVLMCSASGVLALRRVRTADPADLF